MFKKIDKERAFDGIVEQILDNIQKGRLKKGDSLPAERVMAEEMGVSRPAIREALRALQLLGIITTIQGGANYISEDLEGCLIGPLSILFRMQNGNVRQAKQLRSALEKEDASLAAKNCTPLDEAELRMILARLDASENEKIRGDLDRELHIKIGKMAGNPMIFSVLSASSQLMENIITGIRGYLMQKNNSVLEIDEQHHLLVDAIAEKDEKRAKKYMQEHMDSVERYIEEIAKKEQL